jgi:two-component sensor histidine kinase
VTHVLLRTGFPKPLAEIDADLLRDGRWEGDLLHTTLDGRRLAVASRWVLQGGSPDKPRRVMEINSDITERKKAEEQVRLLMGEVNHRSKNVLSVVQSIAMLSSKLADPATYASDLSKRIAGLSACQDLLLHSEWRGVDVAELVRAQLAPFHDLFNRRILLTGAVLRLNAEAAQALGMALHELATNAAKYGALSNSDGRVKIEWSVTSTEDESQFQMQWLEEGGPTVVAPTRKGFGQKVIVSMVEGAVKGKVEVEYRETGVCWKLTSPVQNTIETA